MDQTLKYGSWTMSGTAGGRIGANSCAGAWRASSAKIRVRVNRNPRYSIISLTLFREIRGRQIREEFHGLTRIEFSGWSPLPFCYRAILMEHAGHRPRAAEGVLLESLFAEVEPQARLFRQRKAAVHHAHRRKAQPLFPDPFLHFGLNAAEDVLHEKI